MLAKRFSFVVIVILLHTLVKIVKIVRSHHCLFVAVPIFPSFISPAIHYITLHYIF